MEIPKIIHYCWFGKKKKSKFIEHCISTWKEYFPKYEIIEWNEDNFDLQMNRFAKEAYDMKKYAFVSDFVRVYVLYTYGGIYFDTDIEVKTNFENKLMNAEFVMAFERQETFMTGFVASVSQNKLIKKLLEYYEKTIFINDDGSLNVLANPLIFAEVLKEYHIVMNGKYQELDNGTVKIYPNTVFGGYDVYNMLYTITEETALVHHYTGTWKTKKEMAPIICKKVVLTILGYKLL